MPRARANDAGPMLSAYLQRPVTLLVAIAIAITGFTYRYFGEAFPITSLSITADQHAALRAAQELRAQLNASGVLRDWD